MGKISHFRSIRKSFYIGNDCGIHGNLIKFHTACSKFLREGNERFECLWTIVLTLHRGSISHEIENERHTGDPGSYTMASRKNVTL